MHYHEKYSYIIMHICNDINIAISINLRLMMGLCCVEIKFINLANIIYIYIYIHIKFVYNNLNK
jgi:hypothetical protein